MALSRAPVSVYKLLPNIGLYSKHFGTTSRCKNADAIEPPKLRDVSDPSLKPFKKIPGPPSVPVLGTRLNYLLGKYDMSRPHLLYRKFYDTYGPVVREHVFLNKSVVHLFDLKDMMEVHRSVSPPELFAGTSYPIRISHRALKKYRDSRKDIYDHSGLGPSNGAEWLNFRRKWEYLDLKKTMLNVADGVANDMVKRIECSLDSKNEVDVMPILYDWALESIGLLAVGRRLGCLSGEKTDEARRLIDAVEDTHDAIFRTEHLPFIFGKQYKRLVVAQDYTASVIQKYIDETYKEWELKYGVRYQDWWSEGKDNSEIPKGLPSDVSSAIGQMMLVQKELTKSDILLVILDMFQGGIHNVAHSLAFALYYVSLNADVQETLHQDLLAFLPNKDKTIERTGCSSLQKAITETYRLKPGAIGTGRLTTKDLALGGYLVPAGTIVLLHQQVAAVLEKNISDPLAFRIDRTGGKKIVPGPFGHGPRGCIGESIARIEIFVALAKILRQFKISYHHEEIGTVNRLINEPDKPVRVRFERIA